MEKILLVISVVSTLLFFGKLILSLVGGDVGDVDIDVNGDFDMDGDGDFTSFTHTITITNLLGFFMGFGWLGLGFLTIFSSKILVILLSMAGGLAFFFITNLIVLAMWKLHNNPSDVSEDYIGCTGLVEIRIPKNMEGTGKIFATVNGVSRDLDAYTKGKRIPRNSAVKIVSVHNNIPIVELI